MRRSRAITVTLLSGLMLSACCFSMTGCGGRRAADRTWHDASGNTVAEKWKTDAQGNRVLDAQGRPIPEPGVPRDRWGREWVFQNGEWQPLPPPAGSSGSSSSYRSSSWLWGGSGYRSPGGTSSFRSFSSGPSIGSSSAPSSSVSRGGFGSTGSSGGG